MKSKKAMENEINVLMSENARLIKDVNNQRQRTIEAVRRAEQADAAIAAQNKIIRKQTEADLLLNALKAVRLIPDEQTFDTLVDRHEKAKELHQRLEDFAPMELKTGLSRKMGI